MIEVTKFNLPEVVDQAVLAAWKNSIRKMAVDKCPIEVRHFIDALAVKLGDFVQIKKYNVLMHGYELLLGGMSEVNGEKINPWDIYPTPVPYMVAADHHAALYRIFHRRGKQGLVDFCKAKVKNTELAAILEILNVEVFRQDRPEFRKVLAEINASKKLESKIDV